jgi:hypothetical protein
MTKNNQPNHWQEQESYMYKNYKIVINKEFIDNVDNRTLEVRVKCSYCECVYDLGGLSNVSDAILIGMSVIDEFLPKNYEYTDRS